MKMCPTLLIIREMHNKAKLANTTHPPAHPPTPLKLKRLTTANVSLPWRKVWKFFSKIRHLCIL
jgi:hypothetical protein